MGRTVRLKAQGSGYCHNCGCDNSATLNFTLTEESVMKMLTVQTPAGAVYTGSTVTGDGTMKCKDCAEDVTMTGDLTPALLEAKKRLLK